MLVLGDWPLGDMVRMHPPPPGTATAMESNSKRACSRAHLHISAKNDIHLFPAKYRQSARISVIVHRFRQYGIEHLLLDTAHKVRYSAA